MKYIIVEYKTLEREYPFIFADALVHADFAKFAIESLAKTYECDTAALSVVAAGFCDSYGINSSFNGRSETLEVESKDTDGLFIKTYDYNHGDREQADMVAFVLAKRFLK